MTGGLRVSPRDVTAILRSRGRLLDGGGLILRVSVHRHMVKAERMER
jgi:hypothetical protein